MCRFLLAVWLAVLALVPAPAGAAGRVALLVGNGAYQGVPDLANPGRDARALAAALAELGFEAEVLLDADYETLRRALAGFGARAAEAEVAVIYFAGHGMELDRENYLLPVDARLAVPRDVEFHGMALDKLRRAAEPAARLSLVIVDACRNNPFLEQMPAEGRSLSRGLARVAPAGQNALVAFAAREGTVAEDGEGGNSPYAAALVAALAEPGLEIGKLFRRVRDDVLARTRGRQEPALYGSLSAQDFFFRPPEPAPVEAAAEPPRGMSPAAGGAGALPAASAASPGTREPLPVQRIDPQAVELGFWNAIATSTDPRDFEDYLARFPEGVYAGLAQRRLKRLAPPPPGSPADPAGKAAEIAPPAEPGSAGDEVAMTQATQAPEAGERVEPEPAPPAQPESLPPEQPEPAFRPGWAQVRDTQVRLTILGLDPGPVDGRIGQRTRSAIAAYQRRIGVAADGALSPALLAELEARIAPSRVATWLRTQGQAATDSRPRAASPVAPVKPAPTAQPSRSEWIAVCPRGNAIRHFRTYSDAKKYVDEKLYLCSRPRIFEPKACYASANSNYDYKFYVGFGSKIDSARSEALRSCQSDERARGCAVFEAFCK